MRRLTPIARLAIALLALAGACNQPKKPAAASAADTTPLDDSTVEPDSSNSSGSTAAPSGLDKSCLTKDTCRPAVMDVQIRSASGKLDGTTGQSLTWQLTALDVTSAGGPITPLPTASATPPADGSGDASGSGNASGTGGSGSSLIDNAAASDNKASLAAVPLANLGAISSRHVVMVITGVPADATIMPVALGQAQITATINWVPTVPGASSLTVVLRDYDRCFVTEADPQVCIATAPLPAYDLQHAPIPIVINGAAKTCPTSTQSGFLGLPNLGNLGGSATASGC